MRRSLRKPEERAFEEGVNYLDMALDELLAARLTLLPDVRDWTPPENALQVAVDQDADANRGARHLLEVEARLRELVSPELEGHLDEWRSEWHSHVQRVGQVGWLLGVQTALRRAGEA